MSDNILKKPVHVAILKPTQLQRLAAQGKIEKTPFGIDPATSAPALPTHTEVKQKLGVPKVAASDIVKKNKKQIKLRVIHESIKPLPEDKQPDCGSCKTAACCRAFVVNITELEYESGLYGDSAVKLTPEIYEQLKGKFLRLAMIGTPKIRDKTAYFLEGKMGEACSFLQDDNRCGIYDIRPVTCRTYTCVGDSRITQGMRDGTEPITPLSLLAKKPR